MRYLGGEILTRASLLPWDRSQLPDLPPVALIQSALAGDTVCASL